MALKYKNRENDRVYMKLKEKGLYLKDSIMQSNIGSEVTAVVCFIIAVALTLSFISMNPSDSPLLVSEVSGEIKNMLGVFGSSLATFAFLCFGLSSYLIIAFLIWFGMNSMAKSTSKSFLGIIVLTAMSMIIISSLLDLIMPYSSPVYYKGGMVGKVIASFLSGFFGNIGGFFILTGLAIITILSSGLLSIKESIEHIKAMVQIILDKKEKEKEKQSGFSNMHNKNTVLTKKGGRIFYDEIPVIAKKSVSPLQYKIMPVIEKIEVPYVSNIKIKKEHINESIDAIENAEKKRYIPINTVSSSNGEASKIYDRLDKSHDNLTRETNRQDILHTSVEVEEIAELMRVKILTNTKVKSYLNKVSTEENYLDKTEYENKNKTEYQEEYTESEEREYIEYDKTENINNVRSKENENDKIKPIETMGYAKYKHYDRAEHFGINSRITIVKNDDELEKEESNIDSIPNLEMGYAKNKVYSREEHFGIDRKKILNTKNKNEINKVDENQNYIENNENKDSDIYTKELENENYKECIENSKKEIEYKPSIEESSNIKDTPKIENIKINEIKDFGNIENTDTEKKGSIEINIDRTPKILERKVITQKKDFFAGDFIQSNFDKDFVDKYYKKPIIDLLKRSIAINDEEVNEAIRQTAIRLENTLMDFGVEAHVVSVSRGPVITRYELELASGTRVSKIVGLTDNIALALASESVRIIAPIPGRSVIGIEIPNRVRAAVYLRDVLESSDFHNNKHELPFVIGKGIYGNNVVTDLTDAPHLLVAGTTGSGKSVCLSTIILSLLYKFRPDELKFIFIDKKRVELSIYNGIPHLMAPVVSDEKKATIVLKHIVDIMEARYERMEKFFVRNVKAYNEKVRKLMDDKETEFEGEPLELFPYIVVVIDELHNLMVVASKEVEDLISRLAGMSRAVGIHLIIATQRPSADVVTGVIKANLPTRIAFQVPNKTNSRIIIDMSGAEQLLGKGDGLFCSTGSQMPERVQGSFVSDSEVKKVVDYLSAQMEPMYDKNLITSLERGENDDNNIEEDIMDEVLWDEAIEIVMRTRKASASFLQRKLKIGYNRAARIVELMEQQGYVGKENGSKPREVFIGSDY